MKFKKILIKKDGNCLFRSISIAVKINHKTIRNFASLYLEQNHNKKISNMTLKEWINISTNMDIKGYCKKLCEDGFWGGEIELLAISNIFFINIFILKDDKNNEKYEITNSFIYNKKAKNIFLLYEDDHYTYMEKI